MFSNKEGNKVRRIAERCAGVGLHALRFDFSSCGESEGEPGHIQYSQQMEDLSAAVDFLEEHHRPSKIFLVGSSMGAATVILYAAKRPYKIHGLVLIAAPSDALLYVKANFSEEDIRRWKETGIWEESDRKVHYDFYPDAGRLDILAAARLLQFPTLVIHGSKDDLVPLRCANEIFELLPHTKSLVVIKKADHQFTREEDRDRVVKLTVDWISTFGA